MKEAKYTIVSEPKSIRFTCPYCHEGIEIEVDHLDFYNIKLWSGGIIECSNCHEDIDLNDWEYD